MVKRTPSLAVLLMSSLLGLAACGVLPSWDRADSTAASQKVGAGETATEAGRRTVNEKALDVALFALGLIDTDYRFGGKNPQAGLDCSGMVSYVFNKAVNIRLSGSAADIAKKGKPVPRDQLRVGDLVFFTIRGKSYAHVGIYIGDGRFVHAPSSRGKVRTENLKSGWFAARFEEARSYFD